MTQNRQFLISTLFAGQVNSGVFAAWLQVWLAMYPTWKARVREEVDAAAARRRTRPEESTVDMLDTLTVEEWEAEFPLVDLCLREAIRLGLPGMSCRKNLSDHDIPIAGTGEVIPPGAFATYLMDDVSRNPDIYTDPDSFDPGRYLDGRNEDKKVPHGYLGWGSGRHPCRKSLFFPMLFVFFLIAPPSPAFPSPLHTTHTPKTPMFITAHIPIPFHKSQSSPNTTNQPCPTAGQRSGHAVREARDDADHGVLRGGVRLRALGRARPPAPGAPVHRQPQPAAGREARRADIPAVQAQVVSGGM